MVDRLRALLDHPLDPRIGRAIVVLAAAISFGFAAVVVIAGTAEQSSRSDSVVDRGQTRASAVARPEPEPAPGEAPSIPARPGRHRQDPQDNYRSAAGRRAERALRSHRALQHVPYRRGRLRIGLIGARGGLAVLLVSAPSSASAHDGWRRFLGRYGDSGDGYLPRFRVDGRHGSGGVGRGG